MANTPAIGRAEAPERFMHWLGRAIAGDLRLMAQQIENEGVSRVLTAVAIIVIAAVIVGVGSSAVLATYSNGRLEIRIENIEDKLTHLDQDAKDHYCHINHRLDEIQYPKVTPRYCP